MTVLQLSTHNTAFVLDVLTLANHWPKRLSQLLEMLSHGREAPIKILYGSQGDVSSIALGWSGHLGYDTLCHWSPTIDLDVVCKSLGIIHNCQTGLPTLCQKLLGFEILKDMQLSNWGARPITSQQVRVRQTFQTYRFYCSNHILETIHFYH